MARKPDVQYIRFVTDGTAARKAETPVSKPRTRLPKVKKQKQTNVIHIDPLAGIGVVLSVVMLVLMVISCFQLQSYQREANAMDDYVDYLKTENNRLSAEYDKAVDLVAIEDMAYALGLVPIGEVQHLSVQVEHPVEEFAEQSPLNSLLTDLFR